MVLPLETAVPTRNVMRSRMSGRIGSIGWDDSLAGAAGSCGLDRVASVRLSPPFAGLSRRPT